jgi:hypothetical protein
MCGGSLIAVLEAADFPSQFLNPTRLLPPLILKTTSFFFMFASPINLKNVSVNFFEALLSVIYCTTTATG